jgi:hypothetical protein
MLNPMAAALASDLTRHSISRPSGFHFPPPAFWKRKIEPYVSLHFLGAAQYGTDRE